MYRNILFVITPIETTPLRTTVIHLFRDKSVHDPRIRESIGLNIQIRMKEIKKLNGSLPSRNIRKESTILGMKSSILKFETKIYKNPRFHRYI